MASNDKRKLNHKAPLPDSKDPHILCMAVMWASSHMIDKFSKAKKTADRLVHHSFQVSQLHDAFITC